MGAQLLLTDGQTVRRTDIAKLAVVSQFSKVPKIQPIWSSLLILHS